MPDVHKFPGHIACDEASNSEIVLPIIYNSRLIGVLDIDSPELNRFDEEDTKLFESALDILSAQSDMEAITAAYRK
jgi:GAF domain-containing protein